MSERIKLVSGDSRPQIYVSITDKKFGQPIDLSQVDIQMRFRAQGSPTILATMDGQKLPGIVNADGTTNDAAAAVGVGGRALFNWPSHTLDVPAGYYEGEIVLNFPDGTVQTIYDPVKFKVRDETGG